jgi:phytoene dehydrogenase-like protein
VTPSIDTLLVGSGINSLVCAVMLAKQGHKVHVLEREAVLGGCIRTEALTAPGYLHDTLSAAHPLFVAGPAYAALGKDLHAAGLAYCNTASPTAVLLPDGRHLVLRTARQDNVTQFDALAPGDGQTYAQAMTALEGNAELIFTLLGQELWSTSVLKTVAKRVWKTGLHPTSMFAGQSLQSARTWLETNFQSDLVHALLAPWVLHCGLGPDSAMAGLMAQVVAFTLEAVGMPMVQGGNAQTVHAFKKVIEQHGGSFQCNADVAQVILKDGKAVGVTLASGESIYARNVVCNVTPTQLYTRLVPKEQCPPAIAQQAKAYRYGKGNMQIHLALSEMPAWSATALADVAYVHLTPGLNGVAKAVDEAQRGMLPAEGTIVVGQPSALDPSRAPAGGCVLWIQLPECPRKIAGDAAGLIATPADGTWTESVREAYADRIIARIAQHIPNLTRSVVGRKVISPADLEKLNINLVGGDPYSGECSLDQFLLWRPLPGVKNHATPFKNLWHIGASTHPGPGLGGVSGLHVAQHLAKQ